MDRRTFLKRSAAGLLAAGLWPHVPARAEGADESFTFLVVNDTHYRDENCARYFKSALEEMKKGPPFDFVIFAGDLSDAGTTEGLSAIKRLIEEVLPVPAYVCPGNHDCPAGNWKPWLTVYGAERTNYRFDHRGWTFLGIDTNDAGKFANVVIQPSVIAWLRTTLQDIPATRPLVLFGHHPLGENVVYRVTNADEVLGLFRDHNLRHVFNGHYHALTERQHGAYRLTTDRCLSFCRNNHDGSPQKGWFRAKAQGETIAYEFVEFRFAG